jgi:hypothetical protein
MSKIICRSQPCPTKGGGDSPVTEVSDLGPLTPRVMVPARYLKECHFADNVVVYIDGQVQPHLVWKLHHQL